jgi:hypothetical protein
MLLLGRRPSSLTASIVAVFWCSIQRLIQLNSLQSLGLFDFLASCPRDTAASLAAHRAAELPWMLHLALLWVRGASVGHILIQSLAVSVVGIWFLAKIFRRRLAAGVLMIPFRAQFLLVDVHMLI